MAYRMFLKGEDFNRSAWLRELKSDDGLRLISLSALGCQLRDLHPNWHREEVWLHPLDGIGGVTLRQRDEVELVIHDSCASADVGLAWDLLRLGVKHGANASDEAHDFLGFSEQEIATITQVIQAKCWLNLVSEIQASGEITLVIGTMLSLRVTAEDASHGSIELERRLLARMRRYSHAVIAGLMPNKDHPASPVSRYSQVPTLLSSLVEWIFIDIDGVNFFAAPVPIRRFNQVLEPFIENLGDWNYVPAIDLGSKPDLILALNDLHVGDGILDAADWALLAKAPCLVFIMVVAAEGYMDEKEMELFEKLLNHPDRIASPLVSKIIGITQKNLEGLMDEILHSETTLPMSLLGVRGLLASEKIPASEGRGYARFLCSFAEAVASASGGIFSRISHQEAEALRTLRMLLMVENDEPAREVST